MTALSTDGLDCWAVVVAAGNSTRFGPENKLLLPIEHPGTDQALPLVAATVLSIAACPVITGVVVVCQADVEETLATNADFQAAWPESKPLQFCRGGEARRDSVRAGLAALPSHVTRVAIHDGARPNPNSLAMAQAIQALTPAVTATFLGSPMTHTVCWVAADGHATLPPEPFPATLPREHLWQAYTPQVVWRDRWGTADSVVPHDAPCTDDVQLLLQAHALASPHLPPPVILPIHDPGLNIKVTTPADSRLLGVAMAR